MLKECCGNIHYEDIKVDHWRKFCQKIEDTNWSKRTKYNRWKMVRSFLLSLANDRGLNFEFVRNRQYARTMPHGNKDQWTWQQVQDALARATGVARTALLLGLNAGWYREDIADVKPENFDGVRMNKVRSKLKHEEDAMICSHLIWPETKAVLQYGITSRQIDDTFRNSRPALIGLHIRHCEKLYRNGLMIIAERKRQDCIVARGQRAIMANSISNSQSRKNRN